MSDKSLFLKKIPPWALINKEVLRLLKSDNQRVVAALSGGIASGKSFVSDKWQEMGADIIDFDLLAREVLEPPSPILNKLLSLFSEYDLLSFDGSLNRKLLADLIFNDEGKKKDLEALLHPQIWQLMLKYLRLSKANLIVLVIPLLFEVNLFSLFNPIILVVCNPIKQIARLMIRSGLSEKEAQLRVRSQMASEDKIVFCQYIIENEHSLNDLEIKAKEIFLKLQKNI